MRHFTAKYVLTEWGFLPDVLIHAEEDGKIVQVEYWASEWPTDTIRFDGAICPGFVNAHVHLELSAMGGMIPRGCGMREFVRVMLSRRNDFAPEYERFAVAYALKQAAETGTALMADIANTDAAFAVCDENQDPAVVVFREVLGLDPDAADDIFARAADLGRGHLTAHALYSLSEPLWRLWLKKKPSGPVSLHLLESPEERDFFDGGTILQDFFSTLGLHSIPPAAARFQERLCELNPDTPTLFVHLAQARKDDVVFLIRRFPQAYFCLCPRSNLYLHGTLPDFSLFDFDSGRVCIGTDSLASNDDLSVVEELKTIQRAAPHIRLESLLRCATRNGAAFLGLEYRYGSLHAGARPGLVGITNVSDDGSRLTDESRAIRLL
jgi:cytosine/adenosine deaminase-related metal-dependent hydrolase